MLRAIFTSIASALRSIGRVVGAIVMAPLRFIDRVLVGGNTSSPQEIPEVRPYDAEGSTDNFDRQALYLEIANRVMAWAADSIVADRPLQLPAQMPLDLREWVPGLTREECEVLISADEKAVSAHLQGMFTLPGVRSVQRLPALRDWPAEEPPPAFDEGSPSFIHYAYGWPARSRARARAEQL